MTRQERSLTIEQLTSENARMAEEIRELTYEAVQKSSSRTPPFPGAAPSPVDAPSAVGAGATLAPSIDHTTNSAAGGTAKTTTAAPLEISGSLPPVTYDRRLAGRGSGGGDGAGAGSEGKSTNVTRSGQVPPEELHEAEEALEGREGGSAGAGAGPTVGGTIAADRAEAARTVIEEWDVEALARWGRAALLSLLILYVVACVFVLMSVFGAVCSVVWTVSMSLAPALELDYFMRCSSPYYWGGCGIDDVVRDSQGHALEAAAEEDPLILLFTALGERYPGDAADGSASHPDEADVFDEDFTFCDSDEGGNDCDVLGLTTEPPDIRDLLPARGVVILDACLSVLNSLFTGPSGVVTRLSGALSALCTALAGCIFTVPYSVFAHVVGVCAYCFSGGLREVWIGLQGVFSSAFGRDVILNDHGIVLGIAVAYLLVLGCVRYGLAHIKGVRGAIVALLSAKSNPLFSSGIENADESHADADGQSCTLSTERGASDNAEVNNDHVIDGHTSCDRHRDRDRHNDRYECGGGCSLWGGDRCDHQCNSEIRYENGIAWHVHGGAWVKPDRGRSTEGRCVFSFPLSFSFSVCVFLCLCVCWLDRRTRSAGGKKNEKSDVRATR